jgi:hypothetical protein
MSNAYAVINPSSISTGFQVEIYGYGQLKKIVRNGFTKESAARYCEFEGLDIKSRR